MRSPFPSTTSRSAERELELARRDRAARRSSRSQSAASYDDARADIPRRRSRRSRTRSRRRTSTPRRTRAGSATWRSRSVPSSGSTRERSSASSSGRCSTTSARSASRGDPHQARPAHRRGAGDRREAPDARRADPRTDRAARQKSGRSSARVTSATTARGYPDRLAGEEIPLESRIIFACDAFHAMTTDRPYRRALERRGGAAPSGRGVPARQFDPTVVETSACACWSRVPNSTSTRGFGALAGPRRIAHQKNSPRPEDDAQPDRRREAPRACGASPATKPAAGLEENVTGLTSRRLRSSPRAARAGRRRGRGRGS